MTREPLRPLTPREIAALTLWLLTLLAAALLPATAHGEPYFVAPIIRSDDGTQLAATIRNYQGGEIRVRAAHPGSWKFTGSAAVDPSEIACAPGQRPNDALCVFAAPEWSLSVSVDGGSLWLDEDPPLAPGVAETYLSAATTPPPVEPQLLWYLPQAPIVRYWKFQRAAPDYSNGSAPLTWEDFDTVLNVTQFCATVTRKQVVYWRCLRPLPGSQYLWRVAGGNDAGLGGYGAEPYMVGFWLASAPATGQLPCWWPNPSGPCP